VIVSGRATGSPPTPEAVAQAALAAGSVPVLLGSGLTQENARELLEHASGAIVGTSLKRGGDVAERVDLARVKKLAALFRSLRS
jgi:predicted TIM-barrel enzyme